MKVSKRSQQRMKCMLVQHRHEKILELLAQENTISLQELVSNIDASESTLRRDLVALEEDGLLTRVHGGATLSRDIGKEQKMSQKENINQETKGNIAAYAKNLVQPDTQIYIDAGTATLELVRVLPTTINLHLVTNGIDHALLALQRGIEVTLLGGSVKRNTHAIAGMTAYKQLEKYNFSLSFIGMNGLSHPEGLTTTNIEEAGLKERAMHQSQKIRILMDDSKIDHVFEFKVEAPTQAIILLNNEAKEEHSKSIKTIGEQYDLYFVDEDKDNR